MGNGIRYDVDWTVMPDTPPWAAYQTPTARAEAETVRVMGQLSVPLFDPLAVMPVGLAEALADDEQPCITSMAATSPVVTPAVSRTQVPSVAVVAGRPGEDCSG